MNIITGAYAKRPKTPTAHVVNYNIAGLYLKNLIHVNRGVRASVRSLKTSWNAWKDVLFKALRVWKGGLWSIKKVWTQVKTGCHFCSVRTQDVKNETSEMCHNYLNTSLQNSDLVPEITDLWNSNWNKTKVTRQRRDSNGQHERWTDGQLHTTLFVDGGGGFIIPFPLEMVMGSICRRMSFTHELHAGAKVTFSAL